MRLSRIAPVLMLIAACGKSDDSGAPPPPSCDTVVTTPMPQLTPDQYPEGLSEGIAALQNLEGLWRADHCFAAGRKVDIKITGMPRIPDEVLVVDAPVDPAADCGCTADLTYGADNDLDQVAIVPSFTLFFDPDDVDEAKIDPGLDQQSFEVSGSMYAGGQGLLFRACQDKLIEPYLNSTYDTVVINVRVQTATEDTPLSHLGDVTLEAQLIKQQQGEDPLVCNLVDFTKIQ